MTTQEALALCRRALTETRRFLEEIESLWWDETPEHAVEVYGPIDEALSALVAAEAQPEADLGALLRLLLDDWSLLRGPDGVWVVDNGGFQFAGEGETPEQALRAALGPAKEASDG